MFNACLLNNCFFLIWYGKFKSTIFRYMFIERMSNNCKTVVSIVFFIMQLSLNAFAQFWYGQFEPALLSSSNEWNLIKQFKKVISIVFFICHCHCLLISNFRNASSNVLDIQNKMFFLNFGLANPNLSSFLGNIQWKIVKQFKKQWLL